MNDDQVLGRESGEEESLAHMNEASDNDQVLGRESGEEESLAHMNEAPDNAREMERFYTLAKRQAWKVEQLSWGQIPPVPEGKGSGENRARRLEIWRSAATPGRYPRLVVIFAIVSCDL